MKLRVWIFGLFSVLFLQMAWSQAAVIRYEAIYNQSSILHSWVTGKGSVCADLVIQASSDLVQFNEIYRYGGICGSSDEELSYSWTQAEPQPGPWFFRIVENGTLYSDTVNVMVFNQTQQLQVFPNPTQRSTQLVLPKTWNLNEVLFSLHASDGRSFPVKIGVQSDLRLDVSELADGFYMLSVQRGNEIINTRFLVQNQ